jgi:hypothetical protein
VVVVVVVVVVVRKEEAGRHRLPRQAYVTKANKEEDKEE